MILLADVMRAGIVLAGFAFAMPLAWRLVPRPRTILEISLSGLGLSLGILSLGMLVLGLLCADCIRLWLLLILQFVVVVAGLWPNRQSEGRPDWRAALAEALRRIGQNQWQAVAIAIIAVGLGLIALSNLYYPFRDFDDLARYAYEARLIYEAQGLPTQLTGYPQLVQFNYAYAFLVYGRVVEWAARLTPPLTAVGAVGAAIALGRAVLDEAAGLLSGLVLLLTPIFVRWATSGYVDVPVAFMITMAALALYRWWQDRKPSRAAWTGLWLGLALWTKQSALLHLGGAGLFVGLTILEDRGWARRTRWLATLRDGLIMLGATLLVAAPWYLRNFVRGGLANVIWSPGSIATNRANPDFSNLIPFPANAEWFGVVLSYGYAVGVIVTAIVALGLLRRSKGEAWGLRVLACLTVPHMLIWWQRYSYNPRHLLPMLPLAAVMVGYTLRLVLGKLGVRWRLAVGVLALLVVGLAWPVGLRYYVFAPREILTGTPSTVEERRYDALDGSYEIVNTIQQTVPAGANIYTMDGRMNFYLSDYETASGFYPSRWDDLSGFDYLVSAPWALDIYTRLGRGDSPILAALQGGDSRLEMVDQAGEFVLYRVNKGE